MYAEEVEWFAEQGFAAASIDYRLAPLYPFPAAIEDMQEFIRFAKANHASLGINPNKIAAIGNSAGGHLAAMAGVGFGDGPRVDAVVDICGLTDMRNPGETQFPISMSFIEQFLGGPYIGRETVYESASPIVHVTGSRCPFLIFHGVEDDVVPVDQSRRLCEALKGNGGAATLVELAGEGHSFSFEAWDRIRSESVAFLKKVFA